MENLALKIRIAVLWIFMAVGMSAAMLLALMMPGMIDELRAGEMEGMQITEGLSAFFAIFWLIPLTMAFLSVTLKGSANRWANIIVGIVVAILNIATLSQALTLDLSIYAYAIAMDISMIVGSLLIIWYAYKWPKEET